MFAHTPIMVDEVLALLRPERGGTFVDGTLGGGGHAEAVLQRLPQGSRLFGIDRDKDAIEAAQSRLKPFSDRFLAIRGNFFDIKTLLKTAGVTHIDGILLDLGVSSYQLDKPERGFSYQHEAPLDMRMDDTSPLTAYEVVNAYPLERLQRVIWEYGEERFAARIAARIVRERERAPIETTTQLAETIKQAIPAANRRTGPHPARRTFQALRIEVNGELEGLGQALNDAHDLLNPGGRMCVITFHSLEDRIVKKAFQSWENPCICPPKSPVCVCGRKPTARLITRKPLVPSEEELERNPRARSAKLRGIERIG